MSIKWKIYCTEVGDEGWQEAWNNTAITTCPNNVAHSVNSNSVVEVAREMVSMQQSPSIMSTNSDTYDVLGVILYDTMTHGLLRRVKVISKMDVGATSYDIEIYDVTNTQQLATANFTNTVYASNDTGVIGATLSGEVLIEIRAKRNGGTSENIHVTSAVFFSNHTFENK